MSTKVHKLEVMIIDHDGLGAESVIQSLEYGRFSNDCINPQVVSVDTREAEWTDEHPLNQRSGWRVAFDKLFATDKEGT